MRIALLATLLALTACSSLTPTQQKWAGIAAGVLVVGAIAAHRDEPQEASPRYPMCLPNNPRHACQ
jgi:hypothetical protein